MAIDYNDPGQVLEQNTYTTDLETYANSIANNLLMGTYNTKATELFNAKEADVSNLNIKAGELTSEYYQSEATNDYLKSTQGITGGQSEAMDVQNVGEYVGKSNKVRTDYTDALGKYEADLNTLNQQMENKTLELGFKVQQGFMNAAKYYAQVFGLQYSPEDIYNYYMYGTTGDQMYMDYLSGQGYYLNDSGMLMGGQTTLGMLSAYAALASAQAAQSSAGAAWESVGNAQSNFDEFMSNLNNWIMSMQAGSAPPSTPSEGLPPPVPPGASHNPNA